jgi:hypothetical protein
MTLIRGILLAILALPFVASAEDTVEVQNKSYWMCKSKREVRTIRVFVKDGVCTTFYSKLGAEKAVGSGRNQDSCQNFLNNIKTNLEKSDWACRDISSTRISASASDPKPAE